MHKHINIKDFLPVVNQIFELERKLLKNPQENASFSKYIDRITRYLQKAGLSYHNPIGEIYDSTRTDCMASISGPEGNHYIISEVIKPIIRFHHAHETIIVQQAVVVCSASQS